MGRIVRRIEPRRRHLEGIHDDERITGERRRCPVGKQYGFNSGVILRSSLVIRVEYAVAIEKPVHRRRDAHAALCIPLSPRPRMC